MPFKADTYRVMIASPSDMEKEREAVTRAVYEWNSRHAADHAVALLPIKWETHAVPKAGTRPQEAINEQVVRRCDILVGMFWTRIGSYSGVAESGTVEEIDQCVAAGKRVLLYFSDRKINPSKLDKRQRTKLIRFKEATLKTALISNFTSPDKLREMVVLHLLRVVQELKANGSKGELSDADIAQVSDASVTQDFFPITKHWSASQRQILVCIADIKGFTLFSSSVEAMGSGRIDSLLVAFFAAIDKALGDARRNLDGDTEFQKELRTSVVPAIAKPLGDGAMIVWEFSEVYRHHDCEIGMVLFVMDFIRLFQDHFYCALNELKAKSPYTSCFNRVTLGIGLSCGRAWKVAGQGNRVDYVGTPVREAFWLQELAQPYGVVAKLMTMPHLFMERCCAGDGDIFGVDLGNNQNIAVWASTNRVTIHRRRPRRLDTLDAAQELLLPPDDSRPQLLDHGVPLTRDEIVNVFDIRRNWEGRFAADLAARVRDKQVSLESLAGIEAAVSEAEAILKTSYIDDNNPPPGFKQRGVEFHSLIAELSDLGDVGRARSEFTKSIYEFTRNMYSPASVALHKTLEEHRAIYNAIRRGDPDRARELVEKHLEDHYELAKDTLLENPPDRVTRRHE